MFSQLRKRGKCQLVKMKLEVKGRGAASRSESMLAQHPRRAGKSPGEVALHWPERKILLVGDAVVGHPPGRCKLLPDKVVDDPARLRDSVRALLALDFDILLVGDGDPILDSAKDRLRELVDSFPT